jgi:hypothetical protein
LAALFLRHEERGVSSDYEKLREAAKDELALLWHDLSEEVRLAYRNEWSMGCDSKVDRIRTLTLLVGPTAWEDVQLNLLERGIYQRVHAEMGVDAPVDAAALAQELRRREARVAQG